MEQIICLNLFQLMLNIPVNSHGYVGMLPPFCGTFVCYFVLRLNIQVNNFSMMSGRNGTFTQN